MAAQALPSHGCGGFRAEMAATAKPLPGRSRHCAWLVGGRGLPQNGAHVRPAPTDTMNVLPLRALRTLCCSLAVFASASALAYYEAPWSSYDFLTDQRWSQINNRINAQNISIVRRNAGLDGGWGKSKAKAKAQAKAQANHAQQAQQARADDRSSLALGDQASSNLSPVRSYLSNMKLSDEQAGKLFIIYNDVATRLDVPYNDSASGIAAVLAGSYAAYTNQPFPDQFFKPLYEQFAKSMVTSSSFTRTTLAQRTEYYQRQVIAGLMFQLMQLDLQAQPDAQQIAAMRDAAGRAFQEMSGLSPDRVQFTANGMLPR